MNSGYLVRMSKLGDRDGGTQGLGSILEALRRDAGAGGALAAHATEAVGAAGAE